MASPIPKPKEERRNRSEPRRGEWVDLEPLDERVLPELPDGEWDDEVAAIWESWAQDPVTGEYSTADITFALETIRLRQRRPLSFSEFRLRCDILGLTPKGKRDLRWRVKDDAAEAKPKRSAGRSKAGRAHLTAVK